MSENFSVDGETNRCGQRRWVARRILIRSRVLSRGSRQYSFQTKTTPLSSFVPDERTYSAFTSGSSSSLRPTSAFPVVPNSTVFAFRRRGEDYRRKHSSPFPRWVRRPLLPLESGPNTASPATEMEIASLFIPFGRSHSRFWG